MPPLYTVDTALLSKMLERRNIAEKEQILEFAKNQKKVFALTIENGTVIDELPRIAREEFELHPPISPLSGMFFDRDIAYTFDEYSEHLRQSEEFAQKNENYKIVQTKVNPFRNLQIFVFQGQWAMISKGNSPAIYFVIHRPKLCSAIENFVPPVAEEELTENTDK